jgi:hypothetical protein
MKKKIIHHPIQPVYRFPPSREQPPQLAVLGTRTGFAGWIAPKERFWPSSSTPGLKEKSHLVSAGTSYRLSDTRTQTVPSLHLSHHAQPSIEISFNPQQCNVGCRSNTR